MRLCPFGRSQEVCCVGGMISSRNFFTPPERTINTRRFVNFKAGCLDFWYTVPAVTKEFKQFFQ